METKRQKQVAELVLRNFSLLLQQEGRNIYGHQALVTVTIVRMSPDLTLAKIYLSLFNTEEKAAILLLLQEELVKLRQGLGARIRKVVRIIPHIELHLDDTLDEMYRIDALMQRVHEADKLGKE
jgi:ribosome-binding factor A